MNTDNKRDHGGGLDAAIARFGGQKPNWIDLSTGINPVPYPAFVIPGPTWTNLPDSAAVDQLENAAREFWKVPDGAAILAAPGASALIARIPALINAGTIGIAAPTYNEHAAAFAACGWDVTPDSPNARVVVHPNNPDGRFCDDFEPAKSLTIIDESFCDIAPNRSLIALTKRPNTIVLKSFGKFWGLAGLRLGFAIGDPKLIAKLSALLGPWPVSGPALAIGTTALGDVDWANQTRVRLLQDANRMDDLMTAKDAKIVGGTSLFRLYNVDDAAKWQNRLAKSQVWSRIFPYSGTWLRLGLPAALDWPQFAASL